jgi:hypothetical protein
MILNMVQCGVLSPASFFHIRSDFQRHIIACSSAVTNSSSSNTLVHQQDTTNSSRLSGDVELCSVRDKREPPAVWETEDEPPALVVNPGKSRPQRSRPTATNRGCGGQGRPAGGQLLVFGGGSPLLLSPKRGGSGAGPAAAVRCLAAASGNNNVMRGLWGPPDDKEFANFIRHVTNRVHFLWVMQFYGSAEISVVVVEP